MAGLTLSDAQSLLDAAVASLKRAYEMEEYSIAGRTAKRAAVEKASADIDKWDQRVKALTLAASGRSRVRTVSPTG